MPLNDKVNHHDFVDFDCMQSSRILKGTTREGVVASYEVLDIDRREGEEGTTRTTARLLRFHIIHNFLTSVRICRKVSVSAKSF